MACVLQQDGSALRKYFNFSLFLWTKRVHYRHRWKKKPPWKSIFDMVLSGQGCKASAMCQVVYTGTNFWRLDRSKSSLVGFLFLPRKLFSRNFSPPARYWRLTCKFLPFPWEVLGKKNLTSACAPVVRKRNKRIWFFLNSCHSFGWQFIDILYINSRKEKNKCMVFILKKEEIHLRI